MKIVYYLPSLHIAGGLERITTFKANYFAEHFEGYEVTIITSEQADKAPHFPLSQRVRHIDLGVAFDYPFTQSRWSKLLKYPFRYYRFKQRLSRTLTELHPDITISTLRRELNFLNTLKDGSVKIGEFHTARHFYHAESMQGKNWLLRIVKNKLAADFVQNLSKLSKLIVLTHEGAQDWPELHNLRVIPNPITTPDGDFSDCSTHRVIAAGRYSYEKGFDQLIEAWALVTQHHPDWTLHIYGEGIRAELQAQINRAALTDTCILEHAVTNITEKYRESSIFVLSSRFEGLPLVLGEAMACGVTPVAFTCPCGPRDMITDGQDGLLVENGNIELLAKKICYLIEHENIRKEMGQRAHLTAQRFTMEQVALQWKNLFEEVTTSSKRMRKL